MTSRRKKTRSKSGKPKLHVAHKEDKELKRNDEDIANKEIGLKPTKSNKTKKIRKSRTTKEYQNTEREVQMLLACNKTPVIKHEVEDRLSDSVAFFCDALTVKSQRLTRKNDSIEGNTTDDEEEQVDEEANGNEDENNESDKEDTYSGTTLTYTGQTVHQANETTYIQIEELAEKLESLTIGPAVTGTRIEAHHKFCDNELLYDPSKQLLPLMSFSRSEVRSGQSQRTLQRLYTEAQAQNTKVPTEIIDALLQRVEYQVDARNGLFRTYCNSDGAHEFQPIFYDAAVDAVQIPSRQMMRLFLRELRFEEHPALREEHRLANRLDDLYDEYAAREQRKECSQQEARLAAERHVLQRLMAHPPDKSNTTAIDRLTAQMRLVRELRNRLYDTEIGNRELLQQMLQSWQQLKELRHQQQMQYTRLQLRLHVVNESQTKNAASRRRWTERFECDLGEIYREQLEDYYQAKRLWRLERGRDDNSEQLVEKPQRPDLKRLARELKEKLARGMGNAPGDPKVRVVRVNDNSYYTMPAGADASLQRKSYFLKIYCDQEFVGVTRTYRMEPDFRLHINEAIGIVLQCRVPKQLRISLYEKDKLMTTKKLANILMPLGASVTPEVSEGDRMKKITFRSHKQLLLAGQLSLQYDCEEEAADSASISSIADEAKETQDNSGDDSDSMPTESIKATEATSNTCTTEETHLQFCGMGTDIVEQDARFRLLRWRHLQRNDHMSQLRFIPASPFELSDELLSAIGGYGGNNIKSTSCALIEPGNWMDPIDVHKHDGKKRLRALYEALQHQCARMHKMLEHTEQLLIGDEPASWSLFFRTLGLIFNPNRPLSHAQTDDARRLPTAALNAHNKHTFRLILMVVRGTGIPVRDYQQLNLSRDDSSSQQQSSSAAFMASKLKYSNVRPFIVLSYRDKCCRSTTAEGSDPTWNEQLVLSLSGTLTELTDDVKISLYDELVEQQQLYDDDVDGGVRRMDIYQQRVHTNFLGEYRVPIGTLLAVPKLDGVIELQMPHVLLGYRSPVLDDSLSALEAAGIEQHHQQPQHGYPEIRNRVHLWCYVSCEPGAAFAPPLRVNCLECIESPEVQQQLQQWSTLVQELQPSRYHPPLICTPEGKRVCLTRLLQSVPLPPLELTDNAVANACRFVALLNVLRQPNASAAGLHGVWLSNRWLLDTGWCSPKDLGVLLCNFLLRLGLKCWLVLGVTNTHGECTYVLYHSSATAAATTAANMSDSTSASANNLWFIEPTTGKTYSPRDVFCPLIRVHYIVSQTNIYCNVQRETRVPMTSYNLTDSACWLPAFSGRRLTAPTGGVQFATYAYKTLNGTQHLRHHIERKVMKKITAWRTMRKTIWNRAFQPRLLAILEQLEHAATLSSSANNNNNSSSNNNMRRTHTINYSKQLASEFPSYRFNGYTLNFAYTNLTAISERIKSTGLHLRNDALVEFSVAVHVHSYAQNVHSIWLFLLASVPDASA